MLQPEKDVWLTWKLQINKFVQIKLLLFAPLVHQQTVMWTQLEKMRIALSVTQIMTLIAHKSHQF
jgi:hypothetical protein